MDATDRQAIAGLFEKLARVERQMPDRDAEAEQFIGASIERQPGAPYYLAQTVLVQEQALNAAQDRIEALEADLHAARRAPQGGGFLSGLFGEANPPRRTRPAPSALPQGAPGGFLAGAAQTAMGVAGGVLLADALGGMFAGQAAADEAPVLEDPDLSPDVDDGGLGDDISW